MYSDNGNCKQLKKNMRHSLLLLVYALLSLQECAIAAHDTICLNKMHTAQYEYQVHSGYFNYASLDNLFSDNVYSGGNLFYEIAFDMRKNILVQTSVNFSIFDRKPKSLTLYPSIVSSDSRLNRIHQLHFELENSYSFPILKGRFANVNLYITGNWFTSGDYVLDDNSMNPELLVSSIAPGLYGEYYLKALLLYTHLSSTLISYTCRNNYSNYRYADYEEYGPSDFFRENSHIQFPNSLGAFLTNTGCKVNLTNRFGVQIEYHFRYLYDSEPRILKSITSIYSLGLFYRVSK